MNETIQQLGELELLKRLEKFIPNEQFKDDTAEINLSTSKLLINTDLLVDKIHFSETTSTPRDVGWKAICTNISDLASSGAQNIIGYTIGLVIPPETTWKWIEELYLGMEEATKEYGGEIIGGDCSSGAQKTISVTAFGELGRLRLHRKQAKPGDYLVTSGIHGLSRLGLSLLTSDSKLKGLLLEEELKKSAIQTHKRPSPPLKALKALEDSKPTETPWRAAGTDSSDGLINAIRNICISSQCKAVIKKSVLPTAIGWPSGNMWDEWYLHGGEDYKLILSLPKSWAQSFVKKYKSGKIIGIMKKGSPSISWDDSSDNKLLSKFGFNHFE